jgi:hypothetical protein
MRRKILLAVFSAMVTAVGAADAQPQPGDDARYAEGAALRGQHRDAEALALYQELHARTQSPRALAQVALAEGALGRWIDAEAHLATALAATADPWVTRNRAALTASLVTVRAHTGTLVVACDAPGAAVWVDGRRVGAVGDELRVLAGTVNFEVRAEGRAPVARVATVPARGVAREEVWLPAPTRTAAATPVARAAPIETAPHREEPAPTDVRRTLGWVGVGTGAALVVGGAVAWALGRGAASAYNDDPSCPGVGAPSQPGECGSRLSEAQTLEPVGMAGVALGLGLGAAGVVLLATSGRGARPSVWWRACAVAGAGVACRVQF